MESLLKSPDKKTITYASHYNLDQPPLSDKPSVSDSANSEADEKSEQINSNLRVARRNAKPALKPPLSNNFGGLPIYQSCIDASKDPTIILKGNEFGNLFDSSLTTKDIFHYNNAFAELQNR